MASSRKKQDEKNLKTLRELGTLLQNKYCFDCNQRGPTYVNVTIGSFVCTKCSGMLRGITPPHRVKSISMATFTNEEIDLLKSRGNDYCRRVWLGLYDGSPPLPSGDEQAIKDFMVEKYERRRYYLDPGLSKPEVTPNNTRPTSAAQLVSEPKPFKANGVVQNAHRTRPEVNRNHINNNNNINGSAVFVADFDKADIFSSTGSSNNSQSSKVQNGTSTSSFANFDNNPVFSNTSTNTTTTIGTPAAFTNINNWNGHQNGTNNCLNGSLNNTLTGPTVPVQDKYAALKDLDNEIKSQKNLEWSSSGSNGSLYSSPTPTGSMYSSPSPQSSIFGSPSQGQFLSAFPGENGTAGVSNPFSNGGVNWGTNLNGFQQNQPPFANPFMDTGKMNGFSQVFQPIAPFPINTMPVAVNGTNGWAQNPFKVGTTGNVNSNNPFL
ncbi:arf-GAP domain and FG repeat-containing protein 1 isoform X2 [Anoplophora glabripennis]|uniref:arf-GAP domain and FG repeat-containing protein 1 isoform X2 n=1 Tax=Anoplophora glabripennis TaxID=217634 RepID=UPI0008757491|nr:arf-GAP domain and FG repeat-containing protein 1 isoform X2 [Anoplophora glabripennis]